MLRKHCLETNDVYYHNQLTPDNDFVFSVAFLVNIFKTLDRLNYRQPEPVKNVLSIPCSLLLIKVLCKVPASHAV